jgi:hypothetical protein
MTLLCSDEFCKGSYLASFVIEKENCPRKNFVEETFRKQKISKRFFMTKNSKQKF